MPKDASAFKLSELSKIILKRKLERGSSSYTEMLFRKGNEHICKKLLEEVFEVCLAAQKKDRDRIVNELADVFYHALVLAACHEIDLVDIERCLEERHKNARPAGMMDEGVLLSHRMSKKPYSLTTLFSKAGFQPSLGTDVVLFSHNLQGDITSNANAANVFSLEAKTLKVAFQKHGLKVKVGVSREGGERFVERRSPDIITPVVFVAEHVLLPLCVHLLAAYLKERWDSLSELQKKKGQQPRVNIVLCARNSGKNDADWYVFEGTLREVKNEFESLVVRE